MSGYYKKTPWTRKPPASVHIRKGHWSTQGLTGCWDMREGAGVTARDVSGNGNDGKLLNMDADTDWVVGDYGSALDFDGVSKYVSMSNTSSKFNYVHETFVFSLEAVVEYDTVGTYQMLGNLNVGTLNRGFAWFTEHGRGIVDRGVRFMMTNGYSIIYDDWTPANVIPSSGSVKLAVTGDGTTVRFYVDGEEVHSSAKSGGLGTGNAALNMEIGRNQYPAFYWNGKISQVSMRDRLWSGSEIAEIHANPNLIYEPRKTFIPTGGVIAAAGSMILRLLKLRNK